MAERCRLCRANDRDALVEELAERMWDSRRDYEFDPTWPDASSHWHNVMRGFAKLTLNMLSEHG